MTQVIRFELTILNNDKYDSCVTFEGDRNGYGDNILHHADLFKEGLRSTLLQTFDDMWNNISPRIYRLKCSGYILPIKHNPPSSLSDVVHLSTESMEILTRHGFVTFSSFKQRAMSNISHALMLLVWKRSGHFTSDNMDGTNDFSSSMRACVACGKVHHGVRTGQRIGGIKLGFDPSPVREVIAHPHEHCFNPNCFSHEIERMIDPAYVFTPPKPGEDLETDLARTLGRKVVKKDHPVGTGVSKVVKKDME